MIGFLFNLNETFDIQENILDDINRKVDKPHRF